RHRLAGVILPCHRTMRSSRQRPSGAALRSGWPPTRRARPRDWTSACLKADWLCGLTMDSKSLSPLREAFIRYRREGAKEVAATRAEQAATAPGREAVPRECFVTQCSADNCSVQMVRSFAQLLFASGPPNPLTSVLNMPVLSRVIVPGA